MTAMVFNMFCYHPPICFQLIQSRWTSLNVKITRYMVFTPRNKDIKDMDIKKNDECIERLYHTKFLGVQFDAKLSCKNILDI